MIGGGPFEGANGHRLVDMAASAGRFTGMHANASQNGREDIGFAVQVKGFLEFSLSDKGDIVGYVGMDGTGFQTIDVLLPPVIAGLSQSIFFFTHFIEPCSS